MAASPHGRRSQLPADLDALCDRFVAELKSGEIPIPDRLIRNLARAPLVEESSLPSRQQGGVRRVHDRPTNRELEMLWRLSNGRNTEQIAADLGLSKQTVVTHIKRASGTLGVSGSCKLPATKAVAVAIRSGLIP